MTHLIELSLFWHINGTIQPSRKLKTKAGERYFNLCFLQTCVITRKKVMPSGDAVQMCPLEEATPPLIWQSPRTDFEVVPGLFHSGVRVGGWAGGGAVGGLGGGGGGRN